MRYVRLHKKVFLFWTKFLAIQLYINPYISLGIHIDFARPVIDIHFLWLIIAVGKTPQWTKPKDRFRLSCRGFLIEGVYAPSGAVL